MGSLADTIEAYVLGLFGGGSIAELQIQRAALARRFGCAPSQVSYVLGTRFTPERGFIVESRRGIGGFTRIIRILPQPGVVWDMLNEIDDEFSEQRLAGLLVWLEREGLVSRREASIIRSALDSRILLAAARASDELRARLFRSMLLALLADESSWAEGPPGETGDQER